MRRVIRAGIFERDLRFETVPAWFEGVRMTRLDDETLRGRVEVTQSDLGRIVFDLSIESLYREDNIYRTCVGCVFACSIFGITIFFFSYDRYATFKRDLIKTILDESSCDDAS